VPSDDVTDEGSVVEVDDGFAVVELLAVTGLALDAELEQADATVIITTALAASAPTHRRPGVRV
jgi:hypothetical protein